MSEKRYCKRCDRETPHDIHRELFQNGGLAERVFFGLTTLGFSEMLVDTVIECQRCGKETRK